MAHLRRLIWFALGVLLVAVPMLSFAGQSWNVYPSGTVLYATPEQACQSLSSETFLTLGTHTNSPKVWSCFFKTSKGAQFKSGAVGAICTDGTTWNTTQGACIGSPVDQCSSYGGYWGVNQSGAGHYVISLSCYPAEPSCSPPGERLGNAYSLDARCPEVTEGDCPAGYENMQGVGTIAGSGGRCLFGGGIPPDPDPDPDPDPEPEPPGCSANQQSGTINGVHVCINTPPAPPTSSSDNKTDVKTNSDGSSTETTTEKTTTKDPVTNVTTTTITTTVTNKNARGEITSSEVTTETATQTGEGFCEENPNNPVCGGGDASWAGGCDDPSVIVSECEGDPIQCAIAEQTLRTRCALAASDQVLDAFEEIKEYDGTGEGEGLDVRQIEAGELGVSMQGGGAGLSDLDVAVSGRVITVPFSKINPYLDIFGAAILAVAWLSAATILRGAV